MWNRIVVMDGAMGTMHARTPDEVRSVHREYLEAGADILKTNTFMADSGTAEARLARVIADEFTAANPAHPRFIAGAMGPTGDFYSRARALVEGGVDFLLAETITSIDVAQAAIAGFEKLFSETGRELPVMLSVTIKGNGRIPSNETLEDFWNSVADAKLFSVGINCSHGARHVVPHIEKLSMLATVSVSCHPSAGLPNASGGYDETPDEIAAILGGLAERGCVDIVGGCCGTTPAHIRAIRDAVRGISHATIDLL